MHHETINEVFLKPKGYFKDLIYVIVFEILNFFFLVTIRAFIRLNQTLKKVIEDQFPKCKIIPQTWCICVLHRRLRLLRLLRGRILFLNFQNLFSPADWSLFLYSDSSGSKIQLVCLLLGIFHYWFKNISILAN